MSNVTESRQGAYIALPCHPKFPREGSEHTLRALVRSSSVSASELQSFIDKHGLDSTGRFERTRSRADGWIELERTVKNAMSIFGLRREAAKLKSDLEEIFPSVDIAIV